MEARTREQGKQVDAARCDVFAHLTWREVKAGRAQLVVQLGMDQVHLSQVGLRRVARHARAVLHSSAGVRVALDAEAFEQPNAYLVRLREAVRRAAAHGQDDAVDHSERPTSGRCAAAAASAPA
jgi:hypothetical protein